MSVDVHGSETLSIAVIGMAGRWPAAPDVRAFWDLLTNGLEAMRRFDVNGPKAPAIARRVLIARSSASIGDVIVRRT